MTHTLSQSLNTRKRSGFSFPTMAILCSLLGGVFVLLSGCDTGGGHSSGERVLVRVGESEASVRNFHEEFESGITSPSVLYSDPEALIGEKYRALVRLTEELIIMERARELDIQVSDEEIARAADDFKQDFPDDSFDATLLENGISRLLWEKGLRRRLLMEKVIREDISEDAFQVPLPIAQKTGSSSDPAGAAEIPETDAENMEPPPDEASPENGGNDPAGASDAVDITEATGTELVTGLPANVGEAEYSAWIRDLKAQYAIEIDWELWEKIEQEDARQ